MNVPSNETQLWSPPLLPHPISEIPASLETGLLAMSHGTKVGRVMEGQEEMSSDHSNVPDQALLDT